MFTLKSNPSIFYIGRAKDFQYRLKMHLNLHLKDRFHVFANRVGWDKFEFLIVEVCDIKMQVEKENFYLQKYLPLLNTNFFNKTRIIQGQTSLYKSLEVRQFNLWNVRSYKSICIYLYKYLNGELNMLYEPFNSIAGLSKHQGIAIKTISVYLNTYISYRNLLFFTKKIVSLKRA